MGADRKHLGNKGEDLAAKYLVQQGYVLLERNYVYQKAEIDLIAQKESVIAIVEVKTRSTPDFGDPKDFVKPGQMQRILKAANHYVDHHITEEDIDIRLDICGIIINKAGTQIDYVEDAYYHY